MRLTCEQVGNNDNDNDFIYTLLRPKGRIEGQGYVNTIERKTVFTKSRRRLQRGIWTSHQFTVRNQ